MKKIVATLLVLVMLSLSAFALVGCGGNNQTADFVIPEGGYDGSEVTISFYHTMNATYRGVLDNAIVEFNKIFPNITIEHEQIGGYDEVRDQINTEITVGNQPNIAYCYPDHVALYNLAKAVVTLDDLIASDITVTGADGSTQTLGLTAEQIDDFVDAYYNEGKQFGDDKMYTLPLSKSTEILYYNETFFNACNRIYDSEILIDMEGNPIYLTDDDGNIVNDASGNPQTQPNPNYHNETYKLTVPETWEEMKATCQKIKAIDPNCIPLGYDSEANWFITMCEQLGTPYTSIEGDHFLFDNKENHEFVKEFREWYSLGLVTTQEIYGSYTSNLFKATGTTNADGTPVIKSYMSIGSSGGAMHQAPSADEDGNFPFEVGIAPIPQADENNRKAISQGPSLCIFKDSNPQEVVASWLFVKYLATNVEFQAEFSMTSGYMPVIESVKENEIYADFLAKANGTTEITALAVKIGLEEVDTYYTSPAFNGSSEARDQVGALMKKCLSEKTTDVDALIKKAFEDAVAECEYQAG